MSPSFPPSRAAVLGLFACAFVAVLPSCSVIVSKDTTQCRVDADCAARGFMGATCDTTRLACVPGTTPDGGTAECTKNTDCVAKAMGKPSLCLQPEGRCAPVLSAECPTLSGAPFGDDTVVLPMIASLTGANMSSGVERMNGARLAVEEIDATFAGIPAGGTKVRPVSLLECDDTSVVDPATRAATHARDLRLPALIGATTSGIVTAVAQNVTIPGGQFLILPSATSAALTGLSPLVWRTAPSDVLQAVALRASVGEMETAYKAANMLTTVKIAIVYKDDSYGTGLFGSVTTGLMLNGKPIDDATNVPLRKYVQYSATATDPAFAQVVMDLTMFRPHLVLLFGTSEVAAKILQPLEAGWGASPPPRPVYLLADGGKRQELLTAVTAGPMSLRTRIRGTAPGTNSAQFQAFSNRYEGKYKVRPQTFGTAGSYDSTYLIAYTMASLAGKGITGAALGEAMAKMIGGTPTNIEPGTLAAAFGALGMNGKLDVNGASGPLDFDLVKHEAESDIDVWCVGAMGPAFASSGRYYDAASKAMSGTFSCP
jgi:branched-chain amino acid transport system substrate-binding protein